MDQDNYEVIIIGAGLAGLSSARTLTRSGINDYLILEAKDRVGGRIFTKDYGNFNFDFGAQWIHGQKGNKLYDFAVQHDLISSQQSAEGEGMYLAKGGKEIDPSLVEDINNRVEDVLSKLKTDCTDKQTIDQVLAQVKEGQWNTEFEGLLKWHHNYQLIDNSCYQMNELSVDAWKQYEDCEGPYCQTIIDGFSSIIQRMKSGIPSEKIRCSQVVQRVDWDENVDNSSNNNSLPTVTVVLKNGDKISCKHLIVTCSAGYLKKHKDIFNPLLPKDWCSALDRCIGFGPVIKILLVFENQFWKGDCKGFQFVWTEANPDDYWPQYMTGFDVVQSTESETVLLGWLGGVGCGFLEDSKISDAELGKECVKLLKDFTSIQDIPNPKLTIRTRWSEDPYTLGAYSYRKDVIDPILLEPIGPFADSQQKSKVPLLLFAGEAFHVKYYSTAHGAFESGDEQALKIIQWKNGNPY